MANSRQNHSNGHDDETEIKKWFNKYLTSIIQGDLDTYLASWSDDMILLPPNQQAKMGKESCREIAEGILRSDIEPVVKEQEIMVSGDLAFSRNLVSERFTPKNGGESYVVEFKSVFIFRCQVDGSWVGNHCILNSTS